MIIKVSNKGYKVKPTKEQMAWEVVPTLKNNKGSNVVIPMLASLLEKGHSVILAEFKEIGNIDKKNIEKIELLALDVDSKETPITLHEMKALVFNKIGVLPCIEYRTFSDVNYTKFRLIYKFEEPITSEVYEELYKALKWKLGKYIDQQTGNPNRIWAGTNKPVQVNYDSVDFNFASIVKLITNYRKSLERKKVEVKKAIKGNNSNLNGKYIKKEYKKELCEMLKEEVDLKEFIEKHLGGDWKQRGDSWISKCVFPSHTGDRDSSSLSVKGKIYNCFSHCGTGDLFTAAEEIYRTKDFSLLVFNVANEYNIRINEEMLGDLKNE